MNKQTKRKRFVVGLLLSLVLLTGTSMALAYTTTSVGPQSWSNGAETGRYRSAGGNHYIGVTCSASYSISIELRLDVINAPDLRAGYATRACGGTNYPLYNGIDSNQADYRGHFMKSHTGWYGTLADTHP